MRFVKKSIVIGSKKFYYWERGDALFPALVFLHGFPGNHAGLVDLGRSFSESWRVIIPDLPSCGESDPLEGMHTVFAYVGWLESFFSSLNLLEAEVVGHSFGARIALAFSVHHADLVRGLILITPMLKVGGFLTRIASVKFKIGTVLPQAVRRYWLFNKLYREAAGIVVFKTSSRRKKREIMHRDAQEIRRLNPEVTLDLFNEFYKSDLSLLGSQVSVSCLIIAGEKDAIATMESIQELAGRMPSASLRVVKGAGHLLPLESPATTARIAEQWINKKIP